MQNCKVGNIIRTLRQECNMTQNQFADKMNIRGQNRFQVEHWRYEHYPEWNLGVRIPKRGHGM